MRLRIPVVVAALIAATTLTTASASADALFSSNTPIPINATPTNSAIQVAGQTGRVTKVEVTLRKMIHPRGDDVDVLLVSPDGNTSIVMSDNCTGEIPGYTWTFKEDAATRLGSGVDQCGEIDYKPSDASADLGDVFPGAPIGPVSGLHRTSFDGFLGGDPNGQWRLFVTDDRPGADDGEIKLGWSLRIDTAEADTLLPAPGGQGPASTYPVTRTVSGMNGVIEDVDVSLTGLYHQRPTDLDLLLVGPRGQHATLMSDACGGFTIRNLAFTFDDEAPAALPLDKCPVGGAFKPTDDAFSELWFEPAPQEPSTADLSTFDFTDPNGDWRLYIQDDYVPESDGFLAKPFDLQFKVRPAAAVSVTADPIQVPEGEKGLVTISRPAEGRAIGRGTVTVTTAPLTATSGEDFKPVSTTLGFAPGQVSRTVTVEALADAAVEPAEVFALTIGQPTGDAVIGANATATVTIPEQVAPQPTSSPDPTADPTPEPTPDPVTNSPDRQPPVIGRVTVKRARHGTRIRFALSEPAAVTLEVQRKRGRRFVPAGTLTRDGVAGANRIRGRALKRGRYRLIVAAVDAAGNSSTAAPRRFRVARSTPSPKDPS